MHHTSSLAHELRAVGLGLGCVIAVLLCSACSTTSSTTSTPEAAPSSEAKPEETSGVKEEVPNVGKCHTDTTVCDLPEPLQPGLGCFCEEGGQKVAGTAGG